MWGVTPVKCAYLKITEIWKYVVIKSIDTTSWGCGIMGATLRGGYMDEESLWQADLARRNINLLALDGDRVYYEFQYHPTPGEVRWCKTMVVLDNSHSGMDIEDGVVTCTHYTYEDISRQVSEHCLAMRKALER